MLLLIVTWAQIGGTTLRSWVKLFGHLVKAVGEYSSNIPARDLIIIPALLQNFCYKKILESINVSLESIKANDESWHRCDKSKSKAPSSAISLFPFCPFLLVLAYCTAYPLVTVLLQGRNFLILMLYYTG